MEHRVYYGRDGGVHKAISTGATWSEYFERIALNNWITTVTESWAEYAKQESFSGMNLAQFKVLTCTSLTEHDRRDTILGDRRDGIARGEAAD